MGVNSSIDSISGSMSILDFSSANDSFDQSYNSIPTPPLKHRHSFNSPGIIRTANPSPSNHLGKKHKPDKKLSAQDKIEFTLDLWDTIDLIFNIFMKLTYCLSAMNTSTKLAVRLK